MKNVFPFFMVTILTLISGCQKYDDSSLRNDVNDLKNRVVTLEQWAVTVNSNITALQGIVTVLQNNDYVTGITSLTSEPGGYVIAFTKSGSVTIFNGRDGQNGKDGKDGANGVDGKDGADGKDGESPQISVKQDTDGVYYWTLNGDWILADGNKLRVTGENGINGIDGQDGVDGQDGQNGVAPQIRINTDTDEWEISYNNGNSWENTDMKITGDKGDKGDAIFASNGVDNSNPDCMEFTLADRVTKIKVPKYQILGLDFEQPEAFIAGETKNISYTPAENVAFIKFVDIPVGWKVTTNMNDKKFTVTAPAMFDDSNKGGEAIMLVSDNGQHTVIRSINLTANTNSAAITIEGYSGNSMTVYYTNNTQDNFTQNIDGGFVISKSDKTIHSIELAEGTTIIVGRKADGSAIPLRFVEGNLALRDAVDGYIPIGTYSEFQLINTNLTGKYKQEANLDLLDLEWTPISRFGGIFDGDNHTVANLRITGSNSSVGLFGSIDASRASPATISIQNVNIISGSVSGHSCVGGVCGSVTFSVNSISCLISNCSNASSVSGGTAVGAVCGLVNADWYTKVSIIACHNTGSVTGTSAVGGLCGRTDGYSISITDCYNTGSVSGGSNTGGICGDSNSSNDSKVAHTSITNCYNTGSVSGSFGVGGVCGDSESKIYPSTPSTITACYNTGTVTGIGLGHVGGICGFSSSSLIISCYNTGSVAGIGYGHAVGGVCGSANGSFAITACYNTNSVTGIGDFIGGICGNAIADVSSASIAACYNTGSVSGNSVVGGVCGRSYRDGSAIFPITACYWKDISDDNADYGIGEPEGNTGTIIFSNTAWPTTSTDTQWGIGDGSGDCKYWKSLGGWNGGNPVYPKLYYED